jgi:hypothetical protein
MPSHPKWAHTLILRVDHYEYHVQLTQGTGRCLTISQCICVGCISVFGQHILWLGCWSDRWHSLDGILPTILRIGHSNPSDEGQLVGQYRLGPASGMLVSLSHCDVLHTFDSI